MRMLDHLRENVARLQEQTQFLQARVQQIELSVAKLQPPIESFMSSVRADCAGFCAEMRTTKEVLSQAMALLSRDHQAQAAILDENSARHPVH